MFCLSINVIRLGNTINVKLKWYVIFFIFICLFVFCKVSMCQL
jgi:hypothetical protein